MKNITPTRLALARRRTMIALDDFTELSSAQLIETATELHTLLAESDRFSRLAQLGLRQVALDRLIEIDREHQRRSVQAAA